ncbi:helix-loop-helix protein delilah-like [Penaeus japonicus]|uniref:helix-loop-helix protein delilah-like n=1 Tax=Penaeus japonicus TaxID=27405 RepID=UPI001C71309F|nr:helix-loop-helix protein delilah-like [Penaeus japonicus]
MEMKKDKTASDENAKTERGEEKYGLRPRTVIKRLQQERFRQEISPKRPGRSKSRPAPLSKYRRKTANARERHRMRDINNAFDSLRKVLPEAMEVHASPSSMTKITTLRLAVSYIRALTEVLEDDTDNDLVALQNSLQNSLQQTLHKSLNQSFENKSCSGIMTNSTHEHVASQFSHQYIPQIPQASSCLSANTSSVSCSPSTARGSLSSASDLEELLSDDSGLLEDSLDVFHDIPMLSEAVPIDILLVPEKSSLPFSTQLCS